MNCIVCDRCGKVVKTDYDGYGSALVHTRDDESGAMTCRMDLCHSCTVEFLKWLRSKDE